MHQIVEVYTVHGTQLLVIWASLRGSIIMRIKLSIHLVRCLINQTKSLSKTSFSHYVELGIMQNNKQYLVVINTGYAFNHS